jgi:hypothetical protein
VIRCRRSWWLSQVLHACWVPDWQAGMSAYQEAFRDLDRALREFIKSRKGERKGRRLGFPGSRSGAG